MHKLIEWLLRNQRTKSWLARECNVSPAAVQKWIKGETYPARKHRDIIFNLTGIQL